MERWCSSGGLTLGGGWLECRLRSFRCCRAGEHCVSAGAVCWACAGRVDDLRARARRLLTDSGAGLMLRWWSAGALVDD
jgi:hypothetical protein